MGRGRGKGKKQSVIAKRESDPGSGEEEKIPPFRGGRPLKPQTDEIEEVEPTEKAEKDEEESVNGNVSIKDLKTQVITENKRKRKRSVQVKEKMDPVKEENGIRAKSSPDDLVKSFRQKGSRRKNKPRRAAEAVVDCK